MAFDQNRFSVFKGGQTGATLMAHYNGSGGDNQGGLPDEGGDTLASMKTNGFFSSQEVKDAVAMASTGRTLGLGLPCLLQGHNGMEWGFLFAHTDGQIRMGAGAWLLT